MRKHSAFTSGYLLEVMDGTILSETKHFSGFCEMFDWFELECADRHMLTPTARRELSHQISKGSAFYNLGITINEWFCIVDKDNVSKGVIYSVTKL